MLRHDLATTACRTQCSSGIASDMATGGGGKFAGGPAIGGGTLSARSGSRVEADPRRGGPSLATMLPRTRAGYGPPPLGYDLAGRVGAAEYKGKVIEEILLRRGGNKGKAEIDRGWT